MPSGVMAPVGAKEGAGAERRGSTSSEGSATSSSTNTRSLCMETAEYLQAAKSRAATAAPPKPAANPLQFVKVGPCHLYRSAQEQLKKAEEIRKFTAKDVRKEEHEDWQSNLDNWKSSRRKQVEHIIERCVEVKRMELEDTDRNRRRSKTFSEMLENRAGRRNGRAPLPVYCEEDNNDLSDLGIGTSSTSGKSSLSEDCDNHSLASDGMDLEKNHSDLDNLSSSETGNRKLGSSANEYDTCTTATISSPEPEEYTYEGAIQNYKSRISRTQSTDLSVNKMNGINNNYTKDKSENLTNGISAVRKNSIGSKIESKLSTFESKRETNLEINLLDVNKNNIPKVDILKKRELFEKEPSPDQNGLSLKSKIVPDISNSKSIKERLNNLEKLSEDTSVIKEKIIPDKPNNSLKDRLNSLEKFVTEPEKINLKLSNGDLTAVSIKDRLSNFNIRTTPEKTVAINSTNLTQTIKDKLASLDSACNKEIIKEVSIEFDSKSSLKESDNNSQSDSLYSKSEDGVNYNKTENNLNESKHLHHSLNNLDIDNVTQTNKFDKAQSMVDLCGDPSRGADTDQEDSGIHTGNVSSAVSQEDEPINKFNAVYNMPINSQHLNINSEITNVDSVQSNEEDMSSKEEFHTVSMEDDPITREESDAFFEKEDDTVKSLDADSSVFDALDSAFQMIDNEDIVDSVYNLENTQKKPSNCFQENFSHTMNQEEKIIPEINNSSIPHSSSVKPMPLYENIDILYSNNVPIDTNDVIGFPLGPPINSLQPPKEKPPPPPIEETEDLPLDEPMKRMNSTKRIKKEIRNKRSSFLGIEGADDETFLDPEFKLAPRPDITTFLQEESRVEKMLFKKSLYYDSDSNLGESRDSGVELDRGQLDDVWSNKQASPDIHSEQHSRQGSEPFTNTSLTSEEEDTAKNNVVKSHNRHYENSISSNVIGQRLTTKLKELEQEKNNNCHHNEDQINEDEERIQALNDQIKEQQNKEINNGCVDSYDDGHSEEVLRVERELLQLEQEELKRQRDSILFKENHVRRINGRSLQDINMMQSFPVPVNKIPAYSYGQPIPANVNYRQSMPDLAIKQPDLSLYATPIPKLYCNGPKNNANVIKKLPPPIPPAKPLRSAEMQEREITLRNSRLPSAEYSNIDEVMMRQKPNDQANQPTYNHNQMSRHTLQALSAAPRSRLIPAADWLQPKRRSEPPQNLNYNHQHWLIQEAEQRRIDQLRNNIKKQSQTTGQTVGARTKHLPDAVIQTLTQRVQNKNGRPMPPPQPVLPSPSQPDSSEKMLSVSGKKKCSHCGEELGRGAAMIIESLRLFYHLSCFQCCVCGVRLGDGRLGADVRVRHNQLHCHNCYSSDDGVKFSCV